MTNKHSLGCQCISCCTLRSSWTCVKKLTITTTCNYSSVAGRSAYKYFRFKKKTANHIIANMPTKNKQHNMTASSDLLLAASSWILHNVFIGFPVITDLHSTTNNHHEQSTSSGLQFLGVRRFIGQCCPRVLTPGTKLMIESVSYLEYLPLHTDFHRGPFMTWRWPTQFTISRLKHFL